MINAQAKPWVDLKASYYESRGLRLCNPFTSLPKLYKGLSREEGNKKSASRDHVGLNLSLIHI